MYQAHRLAFLYVCGAWPTGDCDHINGERADNRWGNLRDVPHSINSQNQRRPHKCKQPGSLLGAYLDQRRGRWFDAITTKGRLKHLGYFNTELEAHNAYLAAKRLAHAGCTI